MDDLAPAVTLQLVEPRHLAAVRARCAAGDIARAFKAPLDQVWAFLRQHDELRRGHNVFLYHHPERHHPERAGEAMDVDFGVEVDRAFPAAGAVTSVETPAGEVVSAVHRGPYDRLRGAHEAIHAWCAANGRAIGACSWEIYGDWSDDPEQLETTIQYLLR